MAFDVNDGRNEKGGAVQTRRQAIASLANDNREAGGYPHTKATREDWLKVALDTLVSDGVEQVKVMPLAAKLSVSRSSFYWYFKSRQDLLSALLDIWRDTNTKAIVGQAGLASLSIGEGVFNIFRCWVDERLFDPRLDFAVREWARRSGPVRHVLDTADAQRVEAIKALFLRHGYEDTDAFVRARVLYFMQIGYYALELNESLDYRARYFAAYVHSFTGIEPAVEDVERFLRQMRG
jgi:AcrR family transcriptional regulator